ncbi:MAG: efflux RND transporter periplasmic adaptor subunit [Caulobacteraceae bacterium]
MKGAWRWGLAMIAAAIVGLFLWRILSVSPGEGQTPRPTALITVAPVRSGEIDQTIEAYGTVAGSPAATRTLSLPRAVVVEQVLVAPGEAVAAGEPLLVVGPAPEAALAWRQAADQLAFATTDLARIERLFSAHLVASDQLDAARKTLADARAAVAAQGAAGGGPGRQSLDAPFAAIVSATPVEVGARPAADAPLVSLVARGGFVAKLEVEPERAGSVRSGDPVLVSSPLGAAAPLSSKVSLIGRTVDPTTRLVTISVPLGSAPFELASAVEGRIVIARHIGMTVPRASVIWDEKGAHVFVVRGGEAHEVDVSPGETEGAAIEVTGSLKPGDDVAVTGAYQLQDSMAIRIASS